LFVAATATEIADFDSQLRDQKFAPYCGDVRRTSTHRAMLIIPHGAPEGHEWLVALVVLVGLYFAVRNLMRARKRRRRLTPREVQRLEQRSHTRL